MPGPEYEPVQKEADAYWKSTTNPGLAMEMRMGKTLVAVRATHEMGQTKVLVNAPISAMGSWEKELRREGISYARAYAVPRQERIGAFKKALEYKFPMWILMNYEGYRNIPELCHLPFERVICDESTTIKNPKAAITKLLISDFKHVKYRSLLTGFIAPESWLDIFCQMKFLNGSFLGCSSYYDFRERYFEPSWDGYTWIPKKDKTEKIKEAMHSVCFVRRRQDVKKGLPKLYSTRRVNMNAVQAKLYRQVEKEFAYEFEQYDADTVWATTKHIWLQRIAGGFSPNLEVISTAKPDAILDICADELVGQQVVLEYRFEKELDFDYEYFKAKGIKCSMVKGPMTVEKRKESVRRFIDGESTFILCTQKWGKGQMGMDFSNASTMIYRSNELSAELRAQTEDRLLNPFKNDSCLYIDIVCSDTVDEDSFDNVYGKVFSAREAMTNFKNRRGTIKDVFCTPETTPSLFDEWDPFA